MLLLPQNCPKTKRNESSWLGGDNSILQQLSRFQNLFLFQTLSNIFTKRKWVEISVFGLERAGFDSDR